MPTLYDRSVAELMVDAAQEITFPATRSDVVAWFAERYPNVKPNTVRAHVVGLTANDPSRHHYACSRWAADRSQLREQCVLDKRRTCDLGLNDALHEEADTSDLPEVFGMPHVGLELGTQGLHRRP
jgi:hypothetical protein